MNTFARELESTFAESGRRWKSAAAGALGASKEDVLRTRLLLAQGCDWKAAIRAHAETFAGVEPANTTYFVSGFIPDDVLVEVELDAVVADPPR